MANELRVGTAAALAAISGDKLRVGTAALLVAISESPPPSIVVTNITATAATAAIVQPDPDASTVEYQLTLAADTEFATPIDTHSDSDPATRDSWPITGLTPETQYLVRARWVYSGVGVSSWSSPKAFTALAAEPVEGFGWIKPALADVVSGTVDVEWQFENADELYISDGAGGWNLLVSGLAGAKTYQFDSTLINDGFTRLKLVLVDTTEEIHPGFFIDNVTGSFFVINSFWNPNNFLSNKDEWWDFEANDYKPGQAPIPVAWMWDWWPFWYYFIGRSPEKSDAMHGSLGIEGGAPDDAALAILQWPEMIASDPDEVMVLAPVSIWSSGQGLQGRQMLEGEHSRAGVCVLSKGLHVDGTSLGIVARIETTVIGDILLYDDCALDPWGNVGVGAGRFEVLICPVEGGKITGGDNTIRLVQSMTVAASFGKGVWGPRCVLPCGAEPGDPCFMPKTQSQKWRPYMILLHVTRPNKVDFPNRIHVRAEVMGPRVGTREPVHIIIDEDVDLPQPFVCAGFGVNASHVKSHTQDRGRAVIHGMAGYMASGGCLPPPPPEEFEPEPLESPEPEIEPVGDCPPAGEFASPVRLFLGSGAQEETDHLEPGHLLDYSASEYDGAVANVVEGLLRPNDVALNGPGGECLYHTVWLAITHSGDAIVEFVPILNGEKLEDERRQVLLLGSGERETRRYEFPLAISHERAGSTVARRGLRGTWFTFELTLVDACSKGLVAEGWEVEFDRLREQLPGVTYTAESRVRPTFDPPVEFVLGGGSRLFAYGAAAEDDAIPVVASVEPRWVAPAGIRGEAIFTTAYLTVTHENAAPLECTFTPIVDGVEMTPHAIELPATTGVVTRVIEVPLSRPRFASNGTTVVGRSALRGCWFTADWRVEEAVPLTGEVTLEGIDLEYAVVRESHAPVEA